jgi:tripartite-type tricarboxylate transporter receptor subunit TctC
METIVGHKIKSILLGTACALWMHAGAVAQTAKFPDKPIKIVVPFTPGGTNDIMGRVIATKLTEKFGWPAVVDNRGGAGGSIGTAAVASAPADGYTLLVVSSSHTIVPAVQKVSYHAVNSFTPIALVGTAPSVLAASPSLPANTLAEAIALAKDKPGQLSYSFAGIGSISQFIGELFNAAAGVKMVPVAYKGGTPAMTDLMAGHIQLYHGGLAAVLPLIKAGKIKGLGVTSRQRSPAAPQIPAIAETLPGFEAVIWYGVLGPAGMPPDITARLNTAVNAVMSDPEVVKKLELDAVTAKNATPQEFSKLVSDDLARWAEVARTAGIKGE